MTLSELIVKLEAATEGSRELDAAIAIFHFKPAPDADLRAEAASDDCEAGTRNYPFGKGRARNCSLAKSIDSGNWPERKGRQDCTLVHSPCMRAREETSDQETIEITPAMLHAGVIALEAAREQGSWDEGTVREVYIAMARQAELDASSAVSRASPHARNAGR